MWDLVQQQQRKICDAHKDVLKIRVEIMISLTHLEVDDQLNLMMTS